MATRLEELNLIKFLMNKNDLPAAEKQAANALHVFPNDPEFLHFHAMINFDLQRYKPASKALLKLLKNGYSDRSIALFYVECLICDKQFKKAADEALRLAPGDKGYELRLAAARAYAVWGKLAIARKHMNKIMSEFPDSSDALAMNGVLLNQLGNTVDAITSMERAVEFDPLNVGYLFDLSQLYLSIKNNNDAKRILLAVIKIDKNHYPALRCLAEIHFNEGEYEQTSEVLGKALALQQDDLNAWSMYATSLANTRQYDQAIAVLDQLLIRFPDNPILVRDKAYVNIRIGDAEQALELSQKLENFPPAAITALAFQIAILNKSNRKDDAAKISRIDELVQVTTPEPPSGWDCLEKFNAAVTAEIMANEQLDYSLTNRSLVGEKCTPHLQNNGEQSITGSLMELFEEEAKAYIEFTLSKVDAPKIFLENQPSKYMIECWGNVMSSGGNHNAHYHPRAWLSGVYYPCLPEVMCKTENDAGALELGCSFAGLLPLDDEPTIRVVPSEGTLILFPSYLGHRTIPIKTDAKPRISMAFNLVGIQ